MLHIFPCYRSAFLLSTFLLFFFFFCARSIAAAPDISLSLSRVVQNCCRCQCSDLLLCAVSLPCLPIFVSVPSIPSLPPVLNSIISGGGGFSGNSSGEREKKKRKKAISRLSDLARHLHSHSHSHTQKGAQKKIDRHFWGEGKEKRAEEDCPRMSSFGVPVPVCMYLLAAFLAHKLYI